jgi:hypothetical protein
MHRHTPFTYCNGIELKAALKREKFRTITGRQLVAICEDLEAAFPGVTVRPEPITEGGLLYVNWPGKTEEMYKSIRLGSTCYPRINPENDQTFNELRSERGDEVVLRWDWNGFGKSLFLKAFKGAPCFTRDELTVIRDVFERNGVQCLKKLPSASTLCEYMRDCSGNLGACLHEGGERA